jgi:hypothetical protein
MGMVWVSVARRQLVLSSNIKCRPRFAGLSLVVGEAAVPGIN